MNTLILCFDGTSNDPTDAHQDREWFGLGEQEDSSITNVLKLHLLFGGDFKGNCFFPGQMTFYYSGVGTYGGLIDKIRNLAFAPPEEDVGTIIRRAVGDLYKNYREGDRVYVFGFSRGAAIARRFCGVLKDTWEALGKDRETCPRINFMGVFDTVAALKHPNLFKEKIKPASDVVFENGTVSGLVDAALHLISLDERRIAFYPTLMNQEEKVCEVWFAGAHADIGGGYMYDGLSDLTLDFLLDYMTARGIEVHTRAALDIDYDDLFEGSEQHIGYEDVIVQPSHLGKNHEQHALTHLREKMLDMRTPRVNVHDKHSIHPPIIHHSVLDRIRDDPNYSCKSLEQRMLNDYTGEPVGIRVWYGHNDIEGFESLQDTLRSSRNTIDALDGEKIVTVHANQLFNSTGILLREGDRIVFHVDENEVWFDAHIACGADGWDRDEAFDNRLLRLATRFKEGSRRCPDAKWFELVGCINKNLSNCFKAGDHRTKGKAYTATESGQLFLFANDLPDKYGNNRGSIKVRVSPA